jgi:hypothetical protein
VGLFGAFGATRELLALQQVDATVNEALFTSAISGVNKRVDNLGAPAFLRCGKWWVRYRDESPTDTFRMMDVWPAAVVPIAGEPVQVYSEAIAFYEEWRRVGLMFRYSPIDLTGITSWLAKCYAPRFSGPLVMKPDRKAEGNLFYSLDFSCVLVPKPNLAAA